MPRRKITDELWAEILKAYGAWDPTTPDGRTSIADVLAPFGVAKQTFYNEMKRRGVPLKAARPGGSDAGNEALAAVLEALVSCRHRVRILEQVLIEHGWPLP